MAFAEKNLLLKRISLYWFTRGNVLSVNIQFVWLSFTEKFAGKLPGSLRRKFTLFGNAVGLSNDFQNESIHSVRKIPSSVRENIVESWLGGKGPTQIGKELRLQKQLIANIIGNFIRRGNPEAEKGGNKTRFNRAY